MQFDCPQQKLKHSRAKFHNPLVDLWLIGLWLMADKQFPDNNWIALENIRRFQKQIEETKDEDKLRILHGLLHEETRKLHKSDRDDD